MREVKFRAWNKGYEEMHYDWGIDSSLGSALWHRMFANVSQSKAMSKGYELPRSYEHFKGYVFMQYTGLNDSNGIEIYEGDVVKATDDRFFVSDEIIGQVYWNYGCWEVQQYIFKNLNNLEVIGNIYDNPELLEGGF